MPELLIDHDLLVESKDEYQSMLLRNLSWKDRHCEAVNTTVAGGSGQWIDSFRESENSVLAEFMNFDDRIARMASLLGSGDRQLVAMMNRCGDLYNTLDGSEAPNHYPEDAYVTEVSHWVKYSSKYHDTIIDNCETILTDTTEEETVVEELEEILSTLEYADASGIRRQIDVTKKGLKKQGYINNFEESLVAYANEVGNFNMTISSGMADLTDEEDASQRFNRSDCYDSILKKIARE